jgi:opacity protein-like surface antigen
MKRRFSTSMMALLFFASMVLTQDLNAQAIELNGFAGWHLGGKANLYEGEFRINDAMNYGGKIAVGLSTTTYAEISYMRTDTEGQFVEYPSFGGGRSDFVSFSSNYIHVAGLQEVHMGPVSPFATLGAGLVVWSPKTSQLNSKTQFSATFGAGLKIWLSEAIGIRLQGTMLMPMVWNGFGFGCGIGTGGTSCGSSVYTRITPFQGEFSGGLIIRLTPN